MSGSAPVIEARGVEVEFAGRRPLPWRPPTTHTALAGVSIAVGPGETLGLVGESGSGKTTLGRVMLGLQPVRAGSVLFHGREVDIAPRPVPGDFRRRVQAVFQDPYGSLNPTMTVGQILAEPLRITGVRTRREKDDRIAELMAMVGLARWHLDRYPYQFSGGQQQRIAIARALASSPEVVVLDEPVSALDVSIQSQVVNLFERIQAETGVSFLFIAHDLAVVRHISHRVAVMYRGSIVETGPADRVCEDPEHPYTELLLASVLEPDPALSAERRERRRRLSRSLPDAFGVRR